MRLFSIGAICLLHLMLVGVSSAETEAAASPEAPAAEAAIEAPVAEVEVAAAEAAGVQTRGHEAALRAKMAAKRKDKAAKGKTSKKPGDDSGDESDGSDDAAQRTKKKLAADGDDDLPEGVDEQLAKDVAKLRANIKKRQEGIDALEVELAAAKDLKGQAGRDKRFKLSKEIADEKSAVKQGQAGLEAYPASARNWGKRVDLSEHAMGEPLLALGRVKDTARIRHEAEQAYDDLRSDKTLTDAQRMVKMRQYNRASGVLDADVWSLGVNDAFTKGGIAKRAKFELVSKMQPKTEQLITESKSGSDFMAKIKPKTPGGESDYPDLWDSKNNREFVLARELSQLIQARYKYNKTTGMMEPPPLPTPPPGMGGATSASRK